MTTPHPVELGQRVIDTGVAEPPHNRVTQELSEVDDHLAVVESFSHCWALRTDEGLVCVDASGAQMSQDLVAALRAWSTDPVHTLVYTHGHLDHVGGSGAFVADAADRGHDRPRFVAHEAVPARFERYRLTSGWNQAINRRQFGGVRAAPGLGQGWRDFLPTDVVEPDLTYRDRLEVEVGGRRLELHHARGETDDHTWVWDPEDRAAYTGDFVLWVFPNAGNPQKVQRYPIEWAAAMRKILATGAEKVSPAHGLPIVGRQRVEVVHRPWLAPQYDEPEFVVRNVYRQFGGWWDGNPARLKPSPDAVLAAELVSLAGSVEVLTDRALELADAGDLRLACHLVELAVAAAPDHEGAHRVRAEVYWRRRKYERSLMSKGVYAAAARESEAAFGEVTPTERMTDAIGRALD